MGFDENIKKRIRQLAHHSCCLCFAKGVEVHHIIPLAEGGKDVFDNAAPLCASCHETYGANPTKRKLICEAKDNWYKICSERFKPAHEELYEIKQRLLSIETVINNKKSNRKVRWGNVEDAMAFLLLRDYNDIYLPCRSVETTLSLLDILLNKRFWVDKELKRYKNIFIKQYGKIFAVRVLLQILCEENIKVGEGLKVEQLEKIFIAYQTYVQMFVFAIFDVGIQIGVENNNTIHFRLTKEAREYMLKEKELNLFEKEV